MTGDLPFLNYFVRTDEADFVLGTPINNGLNLEFTKMVSAAYEGKIFRFRVAVKNMLGISEYSDEIQLMAVDPPAAPTLTLDNAARTIDSVSLHFTPDADTGGSLITGYKLWRDEGLSGSPFSLIYDGSKQAQLIDFTDKVQTSLEYTYRLYSINSIFQSSTYGERVVKIGLKPSQPGKPKVLNASFSAKTINLGWVKSDSDGGWPILTYEIWIDDGAGIFPSTPV